MLTKREMVLAGALTVTFAGYAYTVVSTIKHEKKRMAYDKKIQEGLLEIKSVLDSHSEEV